MTVVDLRNFAGEVPKQGPSALAPNQAQRATNCRLVSGEVRPYRKPLFEYTPANDALTIYRGSNGTNSTWYTWDNDVNICESPIADTSDYRIYYTGDGVPKKTYYALASASATDGPYPDPVSGWLNMGVPAPTGAPGLSTQGFPAGTLATTLGNATARMMVTTAGTPPANTVTGTINSKLQNATAAINGTETGAPVTVTRAYVYTYLSTFGTLVEESAPSPATLITVTAGQPVFVGFAAPPTQNYNITGINLYRTVTGTSGAEYELVFQNLPLSVVEVGVTDNILDANLIGTVLQTLTWTPPPAGLIGLIDIGYGMLAGFVGNTLYISVPDYPHAWPLQQTLTFPARIVGLGMMGTSLIVCTDQNPWIITGTSPSTLTQEPISIHEPCVSKRSVISNLTGVMYASPNGLVGISELIQGTITDSLIEREAWQNFNPTTMMGVVYDGRYGGFFTLPPDGDLIDGGATDLGGVGFFLDKADEPVRALYAHMDVASFAMAPPLTFMNFYARCVYLDRLTGNLYAVDADDLNIYQLDGDPINFMTTDWKSKRFQYPAPINFAAIQCDADYQDPSNDVYEQQYEAIAAANAAAYGTGSGQGTLTGEIGEQMFGAFMWGGSVLQPLPVAEDQLTFQVIVYAGGEVVATYSPYNNEPLRLPSGFRSQIWEVEVAANYPVRSVTMATSMKELRDAVMNPPPQQGG